VLCHDTLPDKLQQGFHLAKVSFSGWGAGARAFPLNLLPHFFPVFQRNKINTSQKPPPIGIISSKLFGNILFALRCRLSFSYSYLFISSPVILPFATAITLDLSLPWSTFKEYDCGSNHTAPHKEFKVFRNVNFHKCTYMILAKQARRPGLAKRSVQYGYEKHYCYIACV